MGRKPVGTTFGDDVLLKVQTEWNNYKAANKGMTQAKAAIYLGIRQATFSDYLRGGIGLNTQFLLKFAALVGVAPEHFSPLLVAGKEFFEATGVSGFKIQVKGSTVDPGLRYELLAFSGKDSYAFELATQLAWLPAGTKLIIGAEDDRPKVGDVVLVTGAEGHTLGYLRYVAGEWRVETAVNNATSVKKLEKSDTVRKVLGSILPASEGKVLQ